ncbi:hypothetical protein CVT25_006912 [Psilocybe cyanescens]|uniref:Uncharacterized protein n=1 Tax=Psilocybe cyanescens TaxID=93625 RepID=A0A409X647_PSICY|nr:hypothetical protein CVT25_006912 [Psilocybe cyanescens]
MTLCRDVYVKLAKTSHGFSWWMQRYGVYVHAGSSILLSMLYTRLAYIAFIFKPGLRGAYRREAPMGDIGPDGGSTDWFIIA